MDAVLSVYPLSPDETQLDLHGRYHPPLGTLRNPLGAAPRCRVLAEHTAEHRAEALERYIERAVPRRRMIGSNESGPNRNSRTEAGRTEAA